MAELTEQAGLPPPEFEERMGELIVRFRPQRYVPPLRVGHDLSPLQREILSVLSRLVPASLSQIMAGLKISTPRRTAQDNLRLLRSLGLVEVRGAGRWSRWVQRQS